jgi:uncharacterized membrane protein HdeD (DUF308 family)
MIQLIQLLAKNWWALEVRGLLTVVFGILALLLPGMTLGVLVAVFGVYTLAEGAVLLIMSLKRSDALHWWITLLQGIAGIGAGIVTFVWPQISAVILLLIITAWAIVTGVLEIAEALLLRKQLRGEWPLVVSGLLSLLFAYMLLANPVVGALVLISVIGLYAVIFGILQMVLGARFHRMLHA